MTSDASPHHLAMLGVVIVAAGNGERLGADRPKAFVELDGRTLLEHAVRTVVSLDRPGQLVLVVPESRAAEALEIAEAAVPAGGAWQLSVVGGGRERHESVRKGLDALREGIEVVLVHDAARPLTPASVFERVADEVLRTGDGVIPAVPVVDTLKRVDASGTVRSTADRRILVAVQTPQGFPLETLAAAHESAQALEEGDAPSNDAPTDDAEVVQRFGGTVRTITGDPRSHKLTTPEDLRMLHGLLGAVADSPEAATRATAGAAGASSDENNAEVVETTAEEARTGIAGTDAPSDAGAVDTGAVDTDVAVGDPEIEITVIDAAGEDAAMLIPIELPPAPEPTTPRPRPDAQQSHEPDVSAAPQPTTAAADAGSEEDEAEEEELDDFERLLRGLD